MDKHAILGKLTWLWMNSPLHNSWPVELLSRFTLPPIELGQYILIERDGVPVAYCSWAYLNTESEAMYIIDPANLKVGDWNAGDHLWFIDWIAPFGKSDSWEMKRRLSEKFPLSVARAIRVKRNSNKAHVMEFAGREIESKVANAMLAAYCQQFMLTIQNRPVPVSGSKLLTHKQARISEVVDMDE